MGTLVDLSLFAESPTHDGHFSLNSTTYRPPIRRRPLPSTYSIPANISAMASKPLPPLPGAQRVNSEPVARPDARRRESNSSSSSRSQTERPRTQRSAAKRPSYSAVPTSKPEPSAPTLQERRKREPMALPLSASPWSQTVYTRLPHERMPMSGRSTDTNRTNSTAPTMTTCRTNSTTTSVSTSSTRSRSNDSMVWLQDDHVWLMEDRTAASRHESFGFYVPDRSARSILSQYPHDPPPTYREAVAAAEADASSPVRDQFLSLMKAHERPAAAAAAALGGAAPERPSVHSQHGGLQEAMCGISFFPRSEALMPGEASPTPSSSSSSFTGGESSPRSLAVSPRTTTTTAAAAAAPNRSSSSSSSRWFNRPDMTSGLALSLGAGSFPDFSDWPMPPLGT